MQNFVSLRGNITERFLIHDGFKVGRSPSCDFSCGGDEKMSSHHFTLQVKDGGATVNLVVSSTHVDSNNRTEIRSYVADGILSAMRSVRRDEIVKLENGDVITAGDSQFSVNLASISHPQVVPPVQVPIHDTESEDLEHEVNEDITVMNLPSASVDTEKEEEEEEEHVSASLDCAYEMPQSQFAINAPEAEDHELHQQLLEFLQTQDDVPLEGGTQVAPLDDDDIVNPIGMDVAFADASNIHEDITTGVIKSMEEEEEITIHEADGDAPLISNELKADSAMAVRSPTSSSSSSSSSSASSFSSAANPLRIIDPVVEPSIILAPPEVVIDVSTSLVTNDIALQVKAAMDLALAASASTGGKNEGVNTFKPQSESALPLSPPIPSPSLSSSSSSSSSSAPIIRHLESASVQSKNVILSKEEIVSVFIDDSSELPTMVPLVPSLQMKGNENDPENPTSILIDSNKDSKMVTTKVVDKAPVAASTKRSSRFDVSASSTKPSPPLDAAPVAASTKRSPRLITKPIDGADVITAAKRKRGRPPAVINVATFESTGASPMQIEPALSLTQGDKDNDESYEDDGEDDYEDPDFKKTKIGDATSAFSHRTSNVTPRLCFTRIVDEEEKEVQAIATSLGYVHDDEVGVKTILVTPTVLTTPRHVASIVIGQGMVVPQWIRESVKAGRWLPTNGYEPVCSVESLVTKNVKIKVQTSMQLRSLLNGKGILDGKSIYIISGTVPDDKLAIMAKDAGATILKSPPSIATCKRDTAADTLWIIASTHNHGPLFKLMNREGKLPSKFAKGESAHINKGAEEAFRFLKAGVKVLDRLIVPASCLAMKVAPGNANAFDLMID